MFNEEKRLAKEAEKIAEKLKKKPNNARLLKQAETIAQKQAEHAARLAAGRVRNEKIDADRAVKNAELDASRAERKERIAKIDAHNKRVLQETFSEIKNIRQEGKQRRTQMVTDSINEGRARRGEALIGEQQSTTTNPNQTDIASELRKFQQLADEGLISAEEFESKRKQLLGL